ncbi:MAG: hypothetical protein J0L93_01435 [Deltaproteobacteria bacterium]|nr:hypothetical protein [Deltaproteobacteria bacterium]
MIKSLDPYHPSVIFKMKRDLKQHDSHSASTELASVRADTSSDTPAMKSKRTGLAGILDDANAFLLEGQEVVKKIEERLGEMQKLLDQSLDLKLDDSDRKEINKKFQTEKKHLDKIAKESLVGGEELFSGKFAQKGHTLKISENDAESMVLRVPPLHAEGLVINRARVDSLVNARKAVQLMEKAKTEVSEVKKSFDSKQQTVSFKVARIEDAEKLESEAKDAKVTIKTNGMDEYRMKELRRQQERAAEAKGRTLALLINLRG